MVKNIFLSSCRRELQLSNCGFTHHPAEEFVKSQWQNRTKNIFYLLYRWAIAIFFIGAVGSSMSNLVTAQDWGYYFIYLTNWGILMCMITGIYGAILVSKWYFHTEYSVRTNESNEMPIEFKIYWCLHNTTTVIAFIITIVYWTFLHDSNRRIAASNALVHACNASIMFLDILIVSHPIRILHVFQPIGFGIIYAIFTLIFYGSGGVDRYGNPYIYNIIDWSRPGPAIGYIFGIFLIGILAHIFLFVVFKLRFFLYVKCTNKNKIGTSSSIYTSNTIIPSSNVIQSSKISMVFDEDNYNNINNNNNKSRFIEKNTNASYDNKAFHANGDKF